MAELTIERGAIPLQLRNDRPRMIFFDTRATWKLHQKYGRFFLVELYNYDEKKPEPLELVSMEALEFFLWAGLQADAEAHGETLSPEQAVALIDPLNYYDTFRRVVYAVTRTQATPLMLGKATATGPAAEPAAAATADKKTPRHPGPTKVSTSMKRSGSRSGSSAGRRKGSGR